MPYAPGVQDISGQLLAQGMQARAQGIAGGVQTLFQGLQQNQMMTGQALARFQAATAANPKLLDFLNKAGSEESPIPVNPDILKAYADIKSGKTNVQNTSLLAQFADTYNQAEMAQQQQAMRQAQMQSMQSENQLRQAQTMKTLAELQGIGVPKGRIMTLEEFQKLPASIDAKGKPVQGRPDLIEVTDYNLRAGPSEDVKPVDLGGEIGFANTKGEIVRREPKSPQLPPGYERVPSGQAQAPASVGMFMPAQSMAPATSLVGAAPTETGPSPSTVEAVRAMQPPSDAGVAIRPIKGSPQEAEIRERARQEEAKSVRQLNSAQNVMRGIEMVERNLDKTFYGIEPVGMYAGARKSLSQAAVNVAQGIDTIVANIGFDELRSLKESGTSLGQVAIKELDNLQRLRGSLDQNLGKEEFKNTLAEFKRQAAATMERLDYLNKAYKSGATALTEPQLKEYQKLGGTGSPTATQKIQWSSGKEPGTGTLKPQSSFDAGKLQGADRQAYEWLLRNPNDPRADAIRRKLGL